MSFKRAPGNISDKYPMTHPSAYLNSLNWTVPISFTNYGTLNKK